MTKTRKPKNYINNKDLLDAMVKYKERVDAAVAEGKQKPIVPDYIGTAILLICRNLAKKGNFSGYTYKEEMVSDAIIDCIKAVDKFNAEKSNNPFAYFTRTAWNAFLRRLKVEKKETYVKHKNFENSFIMNEQWNIEQTTQLKNNEYSDEVVRNFENSLTKTKKPSKIVGVEKFMEN